jgi:hypothetical protein
MKNDECTIYFVLKSGWKQKYKKINGQWTQTTNGIVRKMTAEQLLSHILPALTEEYKDKVKVIVRRNNVKSHKGN